MNYLKQSQTGHEQQNKQIFVSHKTECHKTVQMNEGTEYIIVATFHKQNSKECMS